MFPIHLEFGNRFIPFYEGAYFSLALFVAFIVGYRTIKRAGINTSDFHQMFLVALISGVLGGRVFQFLFYQESVDIGNAAEILMVWKSGISITGAVILGPIFTYLYCWWKKFNYWKVFALIVPAIILAQGIGRVGCFMNGDAHGTATSSTLGVTFPKYGYKIPAFTVYENHQHISPAWKYSYRNNLAQTTDEKTAPLHPSQLYEAFGDFILFVLLWILLKKVQQHNWDYRVVVFSYLGAYAMLRFLVEFTRADRILTNGVSISQMQWLLILTFLVGLLLAMIYFRKSMHSGSSV